MDACREFIQSLLDHSEDDESLLGVTLVGSLGEGYGHEHWDTDLEPVVTEDRYEEIKRRNQRIIHTEKYDLIFTTIDRLQRVKESDRDEDHWWYKDRLVLSSRTGELEEMLKEIAEYDQTSRLDRLKRHYLGYWDNILSSMGCLGRRNCVSGGICTAIAMQGLTGLLFNLNYGWAPRKSNGPLLSDINSKENQPNLKPE